MPNEGVAMAQRRRLDALIARMVADTIKAGHPPVAHDSQLSDVLDAIARLRERWRSIWDDEARPIAKAAIAEARQHSDGALCRALFDAGFLVRFEMTPSMRAILQQHLRSNVELIANIPDYYFNKLETKIRESIEAGRDVGGLRGFLQESDIPGMTKRRAKLIALNQNNRATAAFTAARQSELGLGALWLHSNAFKTEPRPSHKANNKTPYDPQTGWFDPDVGKFIWPGDLPWCRCSSKTILPSGFA
jgi:uncharacterized protein with gpF-like domain